MRKGEKIKRKVDSGKEEEEDKIKIKSEPRVIFNYMSDKRILAVQTEDTHDTLMEISGYDLQLRFNRDLLKDIGMIESMLDGVKDLFRKLVMEDLLKERDEKAEDG